MITTECEGEGEGEGDAGCVHAGEGRILVWGGGEKGEADAFRSVVCGSGSGWKCIRWVFGDIFAVRVSTIGSVGEQMVLLFLS